MSKQAQTNTVEAEDNQLFYVQITEPNTGKLRIFYLYEGIDKDELTSLFRASFDKSEDAIGFSDETGVLYPPSLLALQPKLFGGRKLYIVSGQSSTIPQTIPTIGIDSQETLVTEEQVIKAFEILDLNSDDVVHKEEFIEAMTLAYSNLFELEPGVAFAYNMIGAKDLAIVTATACYNTLNPKGSYYLSYDDFCAWYMSIGFDPLRELMIHAIELFSSHRVTSMDQVDSPEKPHLMRTKSRPILNLSNCYQDVKLRSFINQFQSIFLLDIENIHRLLRAFQQAGKYSAIVSKQTARTLLLHNLKLNPNVSNIIQNDSSINLILNILFDIIDPSKNENYSLASLLSFIIVCANIEIANNILIFELLFQFYQENLQQQDLLVNDMILYNHLLQIFHLIFYFNRDYLKVTGCNSEQLTHAIYLKLVISVEIKRKEWGKLTLAEFIELFIHGLQLGLTLLQIETGYFTELITEMIGYYPANERIFALDSILPSPRPSMTTRSTDADIDDAEEVEEDIQPAEYDDEEEYADENDDDDDDEEAHFQNGKGVIPRQPSLEEEGESGGRIFKTDTTDLDDQITSFLVGYNGAPITIEEANELLGLHEYNTYDLVKYFIQLCNKDGLISITNFNRGILKLIGDHYISLTVLQRSIVDFILDQITKLFGLKSKNLEKFSLLDICIVLLLFCDDDTFSRGEIILALLKPKSIQFAVVNAVVTNLFKACYLLNPSNSVDEIERQAEKDAKVLCMEYFMTNISPKLNPLRNNDLSASNNHSNSFDGGELPQQYLSTIFTNQQFLKLINFVFTKLENESEQEKLRSQSNDNDVFFDDMAETAAQKKQKNQKNNDNNNNNNNSGKSNDQKNKKNDNNRIDRTRSGNTSDNESQSNKGSSVHAFSEDDDDNQSDGLHLYLDDEKFPPSSTVLELRAAVSILGLEHYKADDLIDKLGLQASEGGRLSAEGWSKWFAKVIQDANISTFDVDIAIALGNKIFAAFQEEGEETISYVDLAIGLSFLCLHSPLEERLMVAFTIADTDSDGFIKYEEFVEIIRSTILIISICSRLVTKKIIAIETSIEDLSKAAALEGYGALGLQPEDDLSLEMLCDLAEDYLKLAALM